MDKRIILEFSDGRTFENLVTPTSDRPFDEVLADISRSIDLMAGRGFKPTGTRTFQSWTPLGWIRMNEAELHAQGPRYVEGFRTAAAFIR